MDTLTVQQKFVFTLGSGDLKYPTDEMVTANSRLPQTLFGSFLKIYVTPAPRRDNPIRLKAETAFGKAVITEISEPETEIRLTAENHFLYFDLPKGDQVYNLRVTVLS